MTGTSTGELTIRQILSKHLENNPTERRLYETDAQFRANVTLACGVLETVCNKARYIMAPYDSTVRMLELAVAELVRAPAPVPTEPAQLSGGQIFLSILDQGETWTDASGFVWMITGMEPRHCRNVINMLHRRADELAFVAGQRMLFGSRPNGEMAQDAFDRALEELNGDPAMWLDGTELLQALRRRMNEEN